MVDAHTEYVLHLADNALVLGQRNAEWCGHGPVLEEDIALANISLDLVGQARMLYQHAASRMGDGCTEDRLAYFRDGNAFRNYTLLELPNRSPLAATAAADRDYAITIVRNFLYSALMLLLWNSLQDHEDPQLAAIAGKSVKEVRYHLRHSDDWLVRLGDGTAESHARTQAALDHLMPYTQDFWDGADTRTAALQSPWNALVDDALADATLRRPAAGGHSEHLGFLLAEMQSLARQHPDASW
jgi:ring-1,2-phenylacetyl-CoA epoxidase subunit PaaC